MTATTLPPSNLSNPSYGYDFVVAVTEDSVNATMLQYLYTVNAPMVYLFWIADISSGAVVPKLVTDNATFLNSVQNIDPFSIPSGTAFTDSRVQTLYAANLMFAVRLKIGPPPGVLPSSLGNIVTFSNAAGTGGAINGVLFNMYCSTFDILQTTPPSTGQFGLTVPGSWLNISQDPSNPWIYGASVNLDFQTAAFTNLPVAVQNQIKNINGSDKFSVQQLLFDLANAGLESSPTISTTSTTLPNDSPLVTTLRDRICTSYFSQMQGSNQPIMGIAATPNAGPDTSTLQPSSLDLWLDVYLDPSQGGKPNFTSGLTTLNYLCSVASTQKSPTSFTWNWVPDEAAQADCDGVVSINRSWFVNYFNGRLSSYVMANCYSPSVTVTFGSDIKVHYTYGLSRGQTPNVTMPATGATILQYSYSKDASDQAGLNGDEGKMDVSTNFTMDVELTGNTIVITQHLVIFTSMSLELANGSGNIVDKEIVDTYTLSVGSGGDLKALLTSSVPTDNSQWSKASSFLNFFDDVNSLIAQAQQWAGSVVATSFTDVPIGTVQGLIFPGAKTFTYKEAGFSPYQDLVALITYTDPST
ncbi:hypothetical protein BDP27DRAFT_1420626 [Rhodocollybia butyracea]|uniref:Uncharacterized protein n=1 Tax=Rhodocollybia butyracea TaxID=206335 RepID=A0A9P5U7A9_9AGAR|nr:hypothetical protein BDP27DRAFT_1420626 [Rhodocollybia butyracea]